MAEPRFNTERHVKYYLRCLKTFLPTLYTSNDSNRMLLAYLTLSGLDVLGVLHSKTTAEERQGYIDWIYHCQVPSGGFRGFPGTDFGLESRTTENEVWDPANIPATFFALVNLLILEDDLERVKRKECLQWLPKVQRADGSFGEVLGPGGRVEGVRDLRYCCCAAGTRYILRGKAGKGLEDVEDIDVPKLVSFIGACQTYDGGMAESPFRESHGGHTYCAISSLDFLNRVSNDVKSVPLLSFGSKENEALLAWLVSRQTAKISESELDEDGSDTQDEQSIDTIEADSRISALPDIQSISADTILYAGFNGRCNKIADTCYSFWNGATLRMLDRYSLIDGDSNRRYLLEKTQHMVGGFGKGIGDPPDLLHSYFGMVSLAFQGEAGLSQVDPTVVTSKRTVQHLESLPWWQ
ncbi:hypothetical protein NUU61_008941 [Penicillium alfredii]|uniref:Geranylgeranyl transferase type-1 subunit beta n=1 Tax=Penicillium alfredii TaxID=1506179 RepID=A0A9W9JX71_9EURO|nr:uncharacterized protein NUU61_008941 [Penicillium alfredii]KAJ5084362.1 hypothetical protein NUU61_008941 [Penicillium alfredii]